MLIFLIPLSELYYSDLMCFGLEQYQVHETHAVATGVPLCWRCLSVSQSVCLSCRRLFFSRLPDGVNSKRLLLYVTVSTY